ncbi:MAG: methionyl-tRNA formyltransferase [Bacteroidales bacterium]
MRKEDFPIIFMGTPDFAVESLKALIDNNYKIDAVVTNPDKPAGRGRKIQESPVKKYAKKQGLYILQPENLKDESFIKELKLIKPALQIVVAFKILPPEVFKIPTYGTFNLHASLLPDYRGAAPINHVIINGEEKTGVTTFFLDEKVDTGKIIAQKAVSVKQDDTAGSLHDKLMKTGSELVVESADKILKNDYQQIDQKELIRENQKLHKAPKIFKEDCRINWNKPVTEVYNFIRGLSPFPSAWTQMVNDKEYTLKIYSAIPEIASHSLSPGAIKSDGKTYLQIACRNGFIKIEEIQLAGKKRMTTEEFLRGFQSINDYRFK